MMAADGFVLHVVPCRAACITSSHAMSCSCRAVLNRRQSRIYNIPIPFNNKQMLQAVACHNPFPQLFTSYSCLRSSASLHLFVLR